MNQKQMQTPCLKKDPLKQTVKHLTKEAMERRARLRPLLTEEQVRMWRAQQDFEALAGHFAAYGAFIRGYLLGRRSGCRVMIRSQAFARVDRYLDGIREECRKEMSQSK